MNLQQLAQQHQEAWGVWYDANRLWQLEGKKPPGVFNLHLYTRMRRAEANWQAAGRDLVAALQEA